MKYAEFTGLCQREWAASTADVVALTLPGPALAQLAADVYARLPASAGSRDAEDREAAVPSGGMGIGLRSAVNPVTGSSVTLTCDPDADATEGTATVRLTGPEGLTERTVPVPAV